MAKADRLERLDIRRAELEEDYRAALIAALRTAAGGSWGLFGHKPDRHAREKWAPVVEELETMAQEIDTMRETLFLEPFALHQEFLASRGPVASNAPGEPKQAAAWLTKLESAA
jgi:hypothetical protein